MAGDEEKEKERNSHTRTPSSLGLLYEPNRLLICMHSISFYFSLFSASLSILITGRL
jgi:hypothetical protein